MELFKKESNAIIYTHSPIFSDKSNVQLFKAIELVDESEKTIGVYSLSECIELLHEIFLNNKSIYMRQIISDAKVIHKHKERNKMTKSLRYKIFKRDRFRCKVCGVTNANAVLEIDHIIPISKGGRTVESNLQTTCFDCNRGKSNS
jgi:5-methylcytosine-specific restriction endonuclease McrA